MKALFLGALAIVFALNAAPQTLDIYFIDVEGGQSTLVVTPQPRRCSSIPDSQRTERLNRYPAMRR